MPNNRALSDEPILPIALAPDSGPLRERASRVTCTLCGATVHGEGEKVARACLTCIDPKDVL